MVISNEMAPLIDKKTSTLTQTLVVYIIGYDGHNSGLDSLYKLGEIYLSRCVIYQHEEKKINEEKSEPFIHNKSNKFTLLFSHIIPHILSYKTISKKQNPTSLYKKWGLKFCPWRSQLGVISWVSHGIYSEGQ